MIKIRNLVFFSKKYSLNIILQIILNIIINKISKSKMEKIQTHLKISIKNFQEKSIASKRYLK